MNITSITVRRLRTGQGYNNVAHEATAIVAEGENPEEVRAKLDMQVQAWNTERTVEGLADEAKSLEWQVQDFRRQKIDLEAQVEALKRQIATMRKTPLEDIIDNQERPF
jgi:ethanolamine utilization microcompartment shell protein EutL